MVNDCADLHKKIAEGFQASAYRGATGVVEVAQADDTITRDGLRFAQLISNKLEPFPLRKHEQLLHQSNSVPGTTNNKTHTLRDAIPLPTQPSFISRDGVVSSGLRDSRGFLETTTSTQRMKGGFSDEVMDAYNKGIAAEAALESERLEIQQAALQTEKPNPWKKSTHDHSNFSKVDEDSYRASYLSRHNLVQDSDVNRKQVHEQVLKGNDVNRDALTDHLQRMHEKTLPRGYCAPSGKQWQTTTHSTFSKFDLKEATNANGKNAVAPHLKDDASQIPLQQRRVGDHTTESATAYAWHGASEQQETRFRRQGALNLVNGVHLMSSKYHHPRADVCTNTSYKPSEIVQGQYVPSSKLSLPAKN